MKIVENLILKACGYTLAILFLFYLAGSISDFTNPYIDFKTFLIILLFGTMISAAGLILKTSRIRMFLRVLIHFTVLFAAFTVIFVISGNISAKGQGAIFSALLIFAFFYAIIFTVMYFIRKAIKKSDALIDKKTAAAKSQNKKAEYRSLYKKED